MVKHWRDGGWGILVERVDMIRALVKSTPPDQINYAISALNDAVIRFIASKNINELGNIINVLKTVKTLCMHSLSDEAVRILNDSFMNLPTMTRQMVGNKVLQGLKVEIGKTRDKIDKMIDRFIAGIQILINTPGLLDNIDPNILNHLPQFTSMLANVTRVAMNNSESGPRIEPVIIINKIPETEKILPLAGSSSVPQQVPLPPIEYHHTPLPPPIVSTSTHPRIETEINPVLAQNNEVDVTPTVQAVPRQDFARDVTSPASVPVRITSDQAKVKANPAVTAAVHSTASLPDSAVSNRQRKKNEKAVKEEEKKAALDATVNASAGNGVDNAKAVEEAKKKVDEMENARKKNEILKKQADRKQKAENRDQVLKAKVDGAVKKEAAIAKKNAEEAAKKAEVDGAAKKEAAIAKKNAEEAAKKEAAIAKKNAEEAAKKAEVDGAAKKEAAKANKEAAKATKAAEVAAKQVMDANAIKKEEKTADEKAEATAQKAAQGKEASAEKKRKAAEVAAKVKADKKAATAATVEAKKKAVTVKSTQPVSAGSKKKK